MKIIKDEIDRDEVEFDMARAELSYSLKRIETSILHLNDSVELEVVQDLEEAKKKIEYLLTLIT